MAYKHDITAKNNSLLYRVNQKLSTSLPKLMPLCPTPTTSCHPWVCDLLDKPLVVAPWTTVLKKLSVMIILWKLLSFHTKMLIIIRVPSI